MHTIQDLHRLIEHRQSGTHWHVLATLAHHQLGRAPDPTCFFLDMRGDLHQSWRHILVGQRHHVLADGLTTRVDPHPRAEPHPEAHGVLTTHGLRIEESGPRTKSRTVQGQSPRCGDGGGRVTHDVEKTYPVEAQAFHERVLHDGHVLEKAVNGLFPVPTNLQD